MGLRRVTRVRAVSCRRKSLAIVFLHIGRRSLTRGFVWRSNSTKTPRVCVNYVRIRRCSAPELKVMIPRYIEGKGCSRVGATDMLYHGCLCFNTLPRRARECMCSSIECNMGLMTLKVLNFRHLVSLLPSTSSLPLPAWSSFLPISPIRPDTCPPQ